jgi:predicted alpha-1,2-mannosidase
MMQSLVDFAEQAGGYGRWILVNIETGIMQGDPTPILISNSYAFGATDFDLNKAFFYMKKGATTPHYYSQDCEVRPFLNDYIQSGITPASMLLEYTSADYAIGQFVRQALNNEKEASFFINRSKNWKKIYNPERNWLCSRKPNGEWKNIKSDWREATYRNYFWMVPYDLETLIDTIGGKKTAEARLDSLFIRLDATYDDDWFAAGNEPDFQIPWIYNWTESPSKTNEVLHRIFREMYNSHPTGLPGNDDLGAMGAWYVFASIGLYPTIPGVGGFSVNIPRFPEIIVQLPKGKLTITGGSETNTKIKTLKINNKKQDTLWLNWKDIQMEGKIEFITK